MSNRQIPSKSLRHRRPGWGRALGTATALLAVDLAVSLWGFRRSYAFLLRHVRLGTTKRRSATRRELATRLVSEVGEINRTWAPYRARCLPLSLVRWATLRREGLEAELRIGVRTLGGHFESHAWIEWDGVAMGESDDVSALYGTLDLTKLPLLSG